MEQYSDMQNYSLWGEYYYGMVTDSNEAPAENYGADFPIISADDNHAAAQPDAAARNAYHVVSSSPETAKGKRGRRSKGAQSTTFLNASISNFRAVVQQHTGCHNAHSGPKGPITLCFATPASTRTNQLYY